MIIYHLPRNVGKTTLLLHRLRQEPNSVLLVRTAHEAKHLRETSAIERIHTWHEWIDGRLVGMYRDPYLLIDNAEELLFDVLKTARIDAISMLQHASDS